MSSQDHPVSSITDKLKTNWPYTLAVTILTLIAFRIRTIPSASILLPNGAVRFATNDAWYHMRTLHTLLANYPDRLFYNPMTNYPYGSF
ncbi:MAG: oligosaccharyl transferase, archaeosortase A system-associated, partial [Methanosarcina sp.]